ncbi:hypothetical protein BV25DRAFT_1915306 [Artomyces pyxidatus]|uniref:Uncharacterized protein n=1 Tax=Artomyces pyxidatus TaxID=48021 RepID=A0ACB8T5W0_9AGAM|nr:hypothetical protein BV25DRAFT_1915306 [Artomyces pyxidatus]
MSSAESAPLPTATNGRTPPQPKATPLVVLVPLTFVADALEWDSALQFSFSFFAIIPLAKLLGDVTEQLSMSLGHTLAGVLNATFGNAVEIIMLGSILSNLLLVLGCSFLAALVIPAAYHDVRTTGIGAFSFTSAIVDAAKEPRRLIDSDTDEQGLAGLLFISRGTAILLFCVYVAYLFFQVKIPHTSFDGTQRLKRDGMSLYLKTHADLFKPKLKRRPDVEISGDSSGEEQEVAEMSIVAASVGLLTVTAITSFVADILAGSIEGFTERFSIPKPFIGLILLPLAVRGPSLSSTPYLGLPALKQSNAGEFITSVWMAMKDKMELPIGVCVGSSLVRLYDRLFLAAHANTLITQQLATFVVPLLVIVGWVSGHDLTLYFDNFETVAFFVSILLVNLLVQDGKSNYMEGLVPITLYLVVALAFGQTPSHAAYLET